MESADGLLGTLTSSSIAWPATSTLRIQTVPSTPVKIYTVTVTGSGGGLVHTAIISLNVRAPGDR